MDLQLYKYLLNDKSSRFIYNDEKLYYFSWHTLISCSFIPKAYISKAKMSHTSEELAGHKGAIFCFTSALIR